MPDDSCSVPDCDRDVYCKALCHSHYRRFRRTGKVGGPVRNRINGSPSKRFWPKVNKNGPVPSHRPDLGPCWLWTASTNPKGYGYFRYGPRMELAHRVAWMLTHGAIPDDLELDHLCRVETCVRISHLEPVTGAENAARKAGFNYAAVCRAGLHDMTDDNVRTTSTGIRVCRTCSPDVRDDFDTHCAKGHRRTGDNVFYITASNGRQYRKCRLCHREAVEKFRRKRQEA